MVLIDSSVWIRFYNPKNQATPEFDAVLALGQAATTDLIMTEVLQGFRLNEKKAYKTALSDFESCIYLPASNKSLAILAANNYRKLRSNGVTPRNTIDVYLATICIENKCQILTYDLKDFLPMVEMLGLNLVDVSSL
jgi:predicted nucleic acid-binding protein